MVGLARENPSHMRPETAIPRRMRVTFPIGVLMVEPVDGNPEYRTALERQSTAHRQKILDPFGCLIASVREQTMVSHPDAEAAGNPPQHDGEQECLPTKEEHRGDCADVKGHHERCRQPNDRLLECSVTLEV